MNPVDNWFEVQLFCQKENQQALRSALSQHTEAASIKKAKMAFLTPVIEARSDRIIIRLPKGLAAEYVEFVREVLEFAEKQGIEKVTIGKVQQWIK